MSEKRALWFALLLFLLSLWKLLAPAQAEAARAWTERCLAPGAEERLEVWGRDLTGAERVAAVAESGAARSAAP
ncbi:MAG: hypothetical protein IK095_03815 [Oscillospiraceae bacterium]|nr:hypothetical protein [Oscillospiraceae bacterium]